MPEMSLVSGNPDYMDYTPSSAVAAGEVVVYGNVVGFAPAAIAANAKGVLCVGPCVVQATTDGTTDTGGDVIYWDNTNKKVTATASSHKQIGYTLPDQGATADDDTVNVFFDPVPT